MSRRININPLQVQQFMRRYCNRRLLSMLVLGFASGLPLPLIASTLQAWYTEAGASLIVIGFLSFTQQPFTYKPLWAPILDKFVPLPWLGKRRGWILLSQMALIVALFVMALVNPAVSPWWLAGLALLVAFFSASQDIAIDAYRTDLLSPNERGLGAANYSLGWRLSTLVSGVFALILAAYVGWRLTYIFMALIMVLQLFFTLQAPKPRYEVAQSLTTRQAIVEPLMDFMRRENAWLIIAFIAIYKIADALALSLNTTFLMRGVGFSLVEIGSVAKIVGTVSVLLGSVIGGVLTPRLGLYRSLMIFGVLQLVSNLAYAWLAVVGKNLMAMATAVAVEFFCSGLSSVAFIVFLTGLCNHQYSATQYALFSSIAALGRVFVGPLAAVMVESMGWVEFYVWTAIAGFPALVLLVWLRERHYFSGSEELVELKT